MKFINRRIVQIVIIACFLVLSVCGIYAASDDMYLFVDYDSVSGQMRNIKTKDELSYEYISAIDNYFVINKNDGKPIAEESNVLNVHNEQELIFALSCSGKEIHIVNDLDISADIIYVYRGNTLTIDSSSTVKCNVIRVAYQSSFVLSEDAKVTGDYIFVGYNSSCILNGTLQMDYVLVQDRYYDESVQKCSFTCTKQLENLIYRAVVFSFDTLQSALNQENGYRPLNGYSYTQVEVPANIEIEITNGESLNIPERCDLNYHGKLTIDEGAVVSNSGMLSVNWNICLDNYGTINNYGYMEYSSDPNEGCESYFNNYGTINNEGEFRIFGDSILSNCEGGTINNSGVIEGTFTNHGTYLVTPHIELQYCEYNQESEKYIVPTSDYYYQSLSLYVHSARAVVAYYVDETGDRTLISFSNLSVVDESIVPISKYYTNNDYIIKLGDYGNSITNFGTTNLVYEKSQEEIYTIPISMDLPVIGYYSSPIRSTESYINRFDYSNTSRELYIIIRNTNSSIEYIKDFVARNEQREVINTVDITEVELGIYKIALQEEYNSSCLYINFTIKYLGGDEVIDAGGWGIDTVDLSMYEEIEVATKTELFDAINSGRKNIVVTGNIDASTESYDLARNLSITISTHSSLTCQKLYMSDESKLIIEGVLIANEKQGNGLSIYFNSQLIVSKGALVSCSSISISNGSEADFYEKIYGNVVIHDGYFEDSTYKSNVVGIENVDSFEYRAHIYSEGAIYGVLEGEDFDYLPLNDQRYARVYFYGEGTFTIPNGKVMTIPNDLSVYCNRDLKIEQGATIINNGMFGCNCVYSFKNYGTLTNDGSLYFFGNSNIITPENFGTINNTGHFVIDAGMSLLNNVDAVINSESSIDGLIVNYGTLIDKTYEKVEVASKSELLKAANIGRKNIVVTGNIDASDERFIFEDNTSLIISEGSSLECKRLFVRDSELIVGGSLTVDDFDIVRSLFVISSGGVASCPSVGLGGDDVIINGTINGYVYICDSYKNNSFEKSTISGIENLKHYTVRATVYNFDAFEKIVIGNDVDYQPLNGLKYTEVEVPTICEIVIPHNRSIEIGSDLYINFHGKLVVESGAVLTNKGDFSGNWDIKVENYGTINNESSMSFVPNPDEGVETYFKNYGTVNNSSYLYIHEGFPFINYNNGVVNNTGNIVGTYQ